MVEDRPAPLVTPPVAPAVTPYDPLAPVYDALYRDAVSLAENRLVFQRLARYLAPPLAPFVLDLGCGTGLLLEYFPLSPARYLGIDCSEPMLAQARRKFPQHHFRLGLMETLPPALPPVSVAVALFGAFAYCQWPVHALQQVAAALMPGGVFVLMPYTHRYPHRGAHARERALGLAREPCCYSAAQLRRLCACVGAFDVSIRGLNLAADALAAWLPQGALDAYVALESATLGRLSPDAAQFLYVELRKREGP
jgi:SAM-dependent methyltransferase